MRERNMASWCSYHPVVSPNAYGKAVIIINRSVCKAGQETYLNLLTGNC